MMLNVPEAGYYKRRLVKGGPWVAVRFWKGPSLDPETGQPLERSHYWQCTVDGAHFTEEAAVLNHWLGCAGHPITVEEYKAMRNRTVDALHTDPQSPQANPTKAVDRRKLAPVLPPRAPAPDT